MPINVGEYYITASSNGNDTYKGSSLDCTKAIIIAKKDITPTISSCSDKTYDGNTTANCEGSITGILENETATLVKNCTFNDKNADSNKTVTCALSLTGNNAENYELTTSSITKTASISKKTLTGTITASNKEYDGTVSATCTLKALSDKVGADDVSAVLGTCTFNTKDVGTGKQVTCTGISLSGNDKGNYVLTSTTVTGNADITKAALSVKADDKTMPYGGSAPTYTKTISGFVNSETESVLGGSLGYSIKNGSTTISNVTNADAGSYDIIPSGLTSVNYEITFVKGTLTIERARTATIPTSANYCQTGLVYDGSEQTLTKTAGVGYTFSGNKKTNAGTYTITATLSSNNYKWNDDTSEPKTFSCSINKKNPSLITEVGILQLENNRGKVNYDYDGDGEIVCESNNSNLTCNVDVLNKVIDIDGSVDGVITIKSRNSHNYVEVEKSITVMQKEIVEAIVSKDNNTVINNDKINIKIAYNYTLTYGELMHKLEIVSNHLVIKNANGDNVSSNSEVLGTGSQIIMDNAKYTIVISGDVNKDGKITALDYIAIRNHMLETKVLSEKQIEFKAADMNNDNRISALDYISIRKMMMEG